MEAVVQCPVCTLFLHPGMSLEDHLNTHPKDQVIQALSQLTLQRANILSSGTQFSTKEITPPSTSENVSNTIFSCNANSSNNNTNDSNMNRKETAVVIQVQASPAPPPVLNTSPPNPSQPHLFNNQSSISYVHDSQKNVMIVNSCSTQYIQQRIANGTATPQKRQLAIAYGEQPGPSNIHIIPRYTSERYSGPPPPYSTAISSTSFNNLTTLARDHYQSSNENSTSSYEVKAHYTEKEDGNFVITEPPQKVVEYQEDENGVLTMSEKIIKSPPRLLACNSNEYDEQEEEIMEDRQAIDESELLDEDDDVQHVENEVEEVVAEQEMYQKEPPAMLSDKVENLTMESCDEITHIKNDRKTTNGLKVLSNVKITTDMISPGLQEILLNKKGRRISKILNKRPQQEDLSPSPPLQCEPDEVMDLTQPSSSSSSLTPQSQSNSIDLDAPSTSRQQQKYEIDSYIEQFEITELSSEDAIEQAEIMQQEEHAPSPPLSSTPTSVIRTIGQEVNNLNVYDDHESPIVENLVKVENRTNIYNKPISFIMSPKPSTSSQDSHLNANHSQQQQEPISVNTSAAQLSTSNTKIGKPILNRPKKLTLKLKKNILNNNLTEDDEEPHIKVEPGINKESVEEVQTTEIEEKKCKIKVEKAETGTVSISCSTLDETSPKSPIPDAEIIVPNTIQEAIEENSQKSVDKIAAEAGPSNPEASNMSSYTITYVEEEVVTQPNTDEKIQFYPMLYIPTSENWGQRFSPPYVPFDERSSYMDMDSYSKSNSVSLASETDTRNGQNSNSFDERAPSADSLNIRTDEKMPAKGEISEQESNGEIDNWNQVYQDPIPQYPSSYDVSTAQECWNLSSNKPEFMHQQYATFPPLQQIDGSHINGSRTSVPFIPKEEKPDMDIEKSESPTVTVKPKKTRTYRCPDCIKSFSTLKQRRLHLISEHQYPEPSPFASKPSSSIALAEINEAGCSSSTSHQQHIGGLSILNDNLSGLSQIVSNFEIVKQEQQPPFNLEIEDIKPFVVTPSQMSEQIFHAVRSENKKMLITYKCSTCRDDFKNLKSFNKHFSVHPAECTMCGRSFTRWATFALHLKRHYNIRDYGCRLCNKTFILRQKLVEHMRVHTGIAPIQCNICHARFRRYSNLAQHRNRHHLNKRPYRKDYVCECGETFVSQAKLEWHRETHEDKPKVCPFCRERFVHKNSLTRHIRLSHPEKYTLLKNKTVPCPYCDKKYLQTSLKAHLETHSKEKNQYSCTICNKEFSTKWNLKQHHWTHANRSSKPFQCNVCPNAFVRENDYITHMNSHKQIRPYTCNHCGCQFVRKSNWMRHTREHEMEKSYSCEICNKKFHRAYYLTEHRRVHTGERPFSCNICGKTSATKTNHNKHIKIHHARDPLTAEG